MAATVSAIFGTKLVAPLSYSTSTISLPPPQRLSFPTGNVGLTIECSSRPQKKATAHHRKTRPRKTNPSDKRHGPAVYPPLPPLPSEWTLLASDSTVSVETESGSQAEAEVVTAE